ncbi:DUF6161 domain-containing protein [Yoonia sp. SDW83-1]|uniref:DUF6161 domain-containing protein n=1 Tax=Yoonia sp. SDW83-1 TaxID=3366945 RepID=UPI00398C6191
MDTAAQNVINQPEELRHERELNNQLTQVQAAIEKDAYLSGDSAIGAYAQDIAKINPELSLNMLNAAMLPHPHHNQLTRPYLEGVAALSAFKLGMTKKGAASARSLLNELSEQYSSEISELKVGADKRLRKLDEAIEAREAKVRQSTGGLARLLARKKSNVYKEQLEIRTSAKDELDKLIADSKGRIEAFEEFYETKIALLEPVSYWKNKRWWHRVSTFIFALIFLGYSWALAWVVWGYIRSFEQGFEAFVNYWKDASPGAFGVVALLIGLILVFSRIIYRLFASQLHLWNDASERITMTETYLALAEKGHNKEEFMGALVNRLFAPASDGVVKDDFGSVSPLEAFSRKYGGN